MKRKELLKVFFPLTKYTPSLVKKTAAIKSIIA